MNKYQFILLFAAALLLMESLVFKMNDRCKSPAMPLAAASVEVR